MDKYSNIPQDIKDAAFLMYPADDKDNVTDDINAYKRNRLYDGYLMATNRVISDSVSTFKSSENIYVHPLLYTNAWASKYNSTCYNNAADDEPVFVLRGQDASAPHVVLHWISKNLKTCPDQKLRDAFEVALLMKNYKTRKQAD